MFPYVLLVFFIFVPMFLQPGDTDNPASPQDLLVITQHYEVKEVPGSVAITPPKLPEASRIPTTVQQHVCQNPNIDRTNQNTYARPLIVVF